MNKNITKSQALVSVNKEIGKKLVPNGGTEWYELQISHVKEVRPGDLKQAGKTLEAVSKAGLSLTAVSRALKEGHDYKVEEYLTTEKFHNLANLTGELLLTEKFVAAYQVMPMATNLLGTGSLEMEVTSLVPRTRALEAAQEFRALAITQEATRQPIEMVVVSGLSTQSNFLPSLSQFLPLDSSQG